MRVPPFKHTLMYTIEVFIMFHPTFNEKIDKVISNVGGFLKKKFIMENIIFL